eukprot:6191774-Pyramimonas_sp.AAC.2
MEPRSSWGVCRTGPRPQCDPCHWRLRWSSDGATVLARGAPRDDERWRRRVSRRRRRRMRRRRMRGGGDGGSR